MTDGNRTTDPASLPMDVKRKLLAARDALAEGDAMEAYHRIYSIACPDFAKHIDEVWTALETPAPESSPGAEAVQETLERIECELRRRVDHPDGLYPYMVKEIHSWAKDALQQNQPRRGVPGAQSSVTRAAEAETFGSEVVQGSGLPGSPSAHSSGEPSEIHPSRLDDLIRVADTWALEKSLSNASKNVYLDIAAALRQLSKITQGVEQSGEPSEQQHWLRDKTGEDLARAAGFASVSDLLNCYRALDAEAARLKSPGEPSGEQRLSLAQVTAICHAVCNQCVMVDEPDHPVRCCVGNCAAMKAAMEAASIPGEPSGDAEDAARYRWLRAQMHIGGAAIVEVLQPEGDWGNSVTAESPDGLDTAVDAARLATTKSGDV